MSGRKSDYPKTVRIGSVEVKIYRVKNRGRDLYQVVYYLGTARKRESFGDPVEAQKEADTKAALLARGQANELTLSGADRDNYLAALAVLADLQIPLASAVDEYVRARKMLGARPLLPAVTQWLDDHAPTKAVATVAEVVEDCVVQKTTDGLSDTYLKPLRLRLRKFAGAVRCPIGDVKQSQIQAYLDSLKATGRTWNNHAQAIRTLFNFAKTRGFLHRERKTEADFIAMKSEKSHDTEIYSVDELAAMLRAGDADSLPFIAIGAFSGIRSFEMKRLDWSNFRWDQGVIEIKSGNAKTGSRRNAPLLPVLAEWLLPYRKKEGPVFKWKKAEMVARSRIIKAKLKWKKNALRHSFGSYRLAEIKDVARVSYEMGNSPRMVHRHYHELVAPKDATEWWGLVPAAANSRRNQGTITFRAAV